MLGWEDEILLCNLYIVYPVYLPSSFACLCSIYAAESEVLSILFLIYVHMSSRLVHCLLMLLIIWYNVQVCYLNTHFLSCLCLQLGCLCRCVCMYVCACQVLIQWVLEPRKGSAAYIKKAVCFDKFIIFLELFVAEEWNFRYQVCSRGPEGCANRQECKVCYHILAHLPYGQNMGLILTSTLGKAVPITLGMLIPVFLANRFSVV